MSGSCSCVGWAGEDGGSVKGDLQCRGEDLGGEAREDGDRLPNSCEDSPAPEGGAVAGTGECAKGAAGGERGAAAAGRKGLCILEVVRTVWTLEEGWRVGGWGGG